MVAVITKVVIITNNNSNNNNENNINIGIDLKNQDRIETREMK